MKFIPVKKPESYLFRVGEFRRAGKKRATGGLSIPEINAKQIKNPDAIRRVLVSMEAKRRQVVLLRLQRKNISREIRKEQAKLNKNIERETKRASAETDPNKKQGIIDAAIKKQGKINRTINLLSSQQAKINEKINQARITGKLLSVAFNPKLRMKRGKYDFDLDSIRYPLNSDAIRKGEDLVAVRVTEENIRHLRKKAFEPESGVFPSSKLNSAEARIISMLVKGEQIRKIKKALKVSDEKILEAMEWARSKGMNISKIIPDKTPPTIPKRIRRKNAREKEKTRKAEKDTWDRLLREKKEREKKQ